MSIKRRRNNTTQHTRNQICTQTHLIRKTNISIRKTNLHQGLSTLTKICSYYKSKYQFFLLSVSVYMFGFSYVVCRCLLSLRYQALVLSIDLDPAAVFVPVLRHKMSILLLLTSSLISFTFGRRLSIYI